MDRRDGFSTGNGHESGGSGGESVPLTARDSRMIERAVRERWPITDAMRQQLPQALAHVITSKGASQRNKIAAARALLSADALNMEQEKRDAGGETINVNVNGHPSRPAGGGLDRLTDDELARQHLAALADTRRVLDGTPQGN